MIIYEEALLYCTAPEPSDLISFSELEIGSTDLAMWKKHLLKACEQNPCFKQTLISALIVVVNSSECKYVKNRTTISPSHRERERERDITHS